MSEPRYVGFWARVLAALVDTLCLAIVIVPVIYWVYGERYFSSLALVKGPVDVLMNWVFPVLAVLLFWLVRSATPGKMLLRAVIVDSRTLAKPRPWQWVLRYLGYYVSTLPLGLGLLWVAFDRRKQGWHDKLARTVVIYGPNDDAVPRL